MGNIQGLEGDIWQFISDTDEAATLAKRYFAPSGSESSGFEFSGAAFDTFAGGGDAIGTRNVFTAEDIVAVTFLGVSPTGHASLAILDKHATELNVLLGRIPTNVDLWSDEEDVTEHLTHASELWTWLAKIPGIGWVTAHKLLARKRPRLIPVYDSVVQQALQPNHDDFWLPMRLELMHQTVIDRLREIRNRADLDDRISLLRVLDVAIWMRNLGAGQEPLPFKKCTLCVT